MIISRRGALAGLGSALVLGPSAALAQRKYTPSVAKGPFYPLVRPADEDHDLTLIGRSGKRAAGQIIEVSGRVLDRRGRPLPRARIELWQANAAGRYTHPSDNSPMPLDPNFQGFGRLTADRDGRYRYTSIKPGAYPDGGDSPRPPHIHLAIRGGNSRLTTQMIFPGDPLNARDGLLRGVPLERLTAKAMGRGANGALQFEWDVVLD